MNTISIPTKVSEAQLEQNVMFREIQKAKRAHPGYKLKKIELDKNAVIDETHPLYYTIVLEKDES